MSQGPRGISFSNIVSASGGEVERDGARLCDGECDDVRTGEGPRPSLSSLGAFGEAMGGASRAASAGASEAASAGAGGLLLGMVAGSPN